RPRNHYFLIVDWGNGKIAKSVAQERRGAEPREVLPARTAVFRTISESSERVNRCRSRILSTHPSRVFRQPRCQRVTSLLGLRRRSGRLPCLEIRGFKDAPGAGANAEPGPIG